MHYALKSYCASGHIMPTDKDQNEMKCSSGKRNGK